MERQQGEKNYIVKLSRRHLVIAKIPNLYVFWIASYLYTSAVYKLLMNSILIFVVDKIYSCLVQIGDT